MLCLSALWQTGEANAATVRQLVSEKRPLAYTTVLTLLDRLLRRGIVTRTKQGRAFVYVATVSRDEMRQRAIRQLAEVLFDGSPDLLAEFARNGHVPEPLPQAEENDYLDTSLL